MVKLVLNSEDYTITLLTSKKIISKMPRSNQMLINCSWTWPNPVKPCSMHSDVLPTCLHAIQCLDYVKLLCAFVELLAHMVCQHPGVRQEEWNVKLYLTVTAYTLNFHINHWLSVRFDIIYCSNTMAMTHNKSDSITQLHMDRIMVFVH